MRHTSHQLRAIAVRQVLPLVGIVLVLAASFASLANKPAHVAAATTSTVNFQARLENTSGSIAADGDYNVEFKIYNTASSGGTVQGVCTGACQWMETRTSSDKVHVVNGYLTVSLGDITAFSGSMPWDQELWITMNIGGTGSPTWDGEMSPRLKLTAVPYAFQAAQASKLQVSTGGNTAILQFASVGQATTITLPDPGVSGVGTVCYQGSASCGFATGTGGSYIQNGTSVQTTANFNIRSAAIGSVGGVIQGANGQTADLLQLQSWNGTTATNVFAVSPTGVLTMNGGQTVDITTATAATSNALTLQPGVSSGASSTGSGLNLYAGNVSGTTTVTGGTVTIQGGNATGGSGTRNGGNVTIDGGTGATVNGTVNIGTTNSPTINIGSVGSTAKATTIHIGDTTTTTAGAIQSIIIGSNSNLAHTTLIQGGSGNGSGSEGIRLLPQTAGGVAIGAASGTGTISLGRSSASNTVNIGNADFTAANTQTINIANGSQTTAASTLNVNVLSGAAGNSGTARLNLGNSDRVTQVDIGNVGGSGLTADANRTLNLFTGAAAVVDTINVGTGAATVAGGKTIHIGDGTPTGSGTNLITIGSIAALANTTTIQGGNGTGAVSVQAAASGTISVGTTNANVVNIGSTAATTTTIRGGSGVNIGDGGTTGAIQIGNTTGAVAQTISIGTNATASATNTINIGSGTTSSGTVTVNAGTGSGNLILLQSNNSTGGVKVKSATNSTAAFLIQDSGSNSYLGVDTSGAAISVGYASSTTTLNGTVKVATLGASTANSTIVCRDSVTNTLTDCGTGSGAGVPFIQGGNSFGTTGVLGTNDTQNLQFETNNIVRATFDQSNGLYLGNGITAAAPNNFTLAGTGSSTAGTAGANLTLQGGAGASTSTGSVGGTLKLVGGSAGGSGNNNGGDVLIQGGAPINTGSGGQVIVRNQGDTTGAFQVQASGGGTPIFNVNTVNSRVGVGGAATASRFEVLGGDAAIYNSGSNPKLILGDSTTAGQNGYLQWDSAGDYFRLETAGTNGLKVKDNFVSIGNIAPSQPLIVASGTTNLFQIDTNGVETLIGGQTADITTATGATATSLTLQPGISSGASTTGASSVIKGGDVSGTTSVTGGVVTIQGGNATGGSGTRNGGSISIDAGTGATANGNISVGTTNAVTLTLGRAAGTTVLNGTVRVTTLGAVVSATSQVVCRDTATGNLTACDSGSGGLPFVQGGNSFGALASLGTNDANNLQIKTNNVVRATFDQSNNLFLGLGATAATPTTFTMQGTGSATAGTTGGQLSVQGGAGATTTTGSAGGILALVGGAAGGSGNNNGGNLTIDGGAGVNSGVRGNVILQGTSGSVGVGVTPNVAYKLDVAGDINISTGSVYRINGADINTAGTLTNVAYVNKANTFTLVNTFSRNGTGTGDYSLGVTGTPINDGTSSLVRIGGAIAGGNAAANGGTYIGINSPAAGAGSTADFFDFQANGATRLQLANSGTLTVGGTPVIQSGAGLKLDITANAASTWSTSGAADLSLQAGGNLNLGNGGGTAVNIGTNNAAHTIGIGNTGATGTQAITIGGTGNTANTVVIQGGTTASGVGAVSIQSASTGLITIGTTNSNPVTISGAGGTTTLNGAVKVMTLGAVVTATSQVVCRDTATGNLTACDGGTGGLPFVQGGNSFNALATLGTNDTNNLAIETNNVTRALFDQSNNLYLGLGVTAAAPTDAALRVTGSATAGTAGAALTIQGGAGASATTGSAGGAVTIQGGNAAGSGNNAGGNIILTPGTKTNTGAAGTVLIQPAAGNDSTALFNIKGASASNIFTVDTSNGRVGIGLGGNTTPTLFGQGLEIADGALRFSNNTGASNKDNYITPNGGSVKSLINVVNYDPGAGAQIIAIGLPSSTANANSRALSVFDARAGAHQPTISLFSVDENSVFGLSWDGSSSVARLKTDGVNASQPSIVVQPAASTGGTAGSSTLAGGDVSGATVTGGTAFVLGGNATGSGTRTGGAATIDGGTGASANGVVNLGISNSNIINIGTIGSTSKGTAVNINNTTDATNSQAVTIGSTATNTGNLTVIQGGSNTTQAIQLLPNTVGGIMIGAAAGTGTITLGQSTATNIVSIGSNTPAAAATQTINIGNGSQSNATSSIIVNVLSGTAGTNGTGQLNLGNNDRVTGIDIGNVVADASRTLNVFSGNTLTGLTDTINIGTGNTAGTGSKVIHIGDGTPAGTNTVTVGSIAATGNVTTIQGGNGAGAVSIQAATSGTINVGTVNNSQLTLGGASSVVKLGSLGASTATAVAVCRDSSSTNLISCGSGGTSAPFLQGGNSFNATGLLGTSDNFGLQIKTNNIVRATFDNATNGLYLGLGITNAAPTAFTIGATSSSTGGTAGAALTIQGGTGNTSGAGGQLTVQGGTGGSTSTGGVLALQGGNAGGGNVNGANITLTAGAGAGTGVRGVVVLGTPVFQTATVQSCTSTPCAIDTTNANNNSALLITANASGYTATLADPTLTTAGRVLYITNSGTFDFTLSVNGGGTGNTITMKPNTTATMIWNGVDWTAAGASSSTDLQAAYDNTASAAGAAELVVSNTANANGLTIRDSSTNPVNGTLLEVQSSTAANLFSVNSNVTDYAADAGAETAGGTSTTFPANTWSAVGSASTSRYITAGGFIATGIASVSTTTTNVTNDGVKNQLSAALTANNHYNVSFATRLAAGQTFTSMQVYYSIDGTAASVQCITGKSVATSVWTKVNCAFTAPSSGITSSNAIIIRQSTAAIRTFYVDNLSVTIAADFNLATDGGVDDAGNFATNWVTAGQGTVAVSRITSDGNDASDSAQANVTAGAANAGLRNKLSINPLPSASGTLYRISVYAKLNSGAAFTDFKVRYSPTGSTASGSVGYIDCVDYNTQTVVTTGWTQITCYITTDATAVTNPYIYFAETASAVRNFSVDTFSMTLAQNTSPNVQIGGGLNGGPVTLFTLDRGASAPIAANNDSMLGSMYYDTTLGKLQCYEADGWGACGSSPDNIVTISPEYTNAVLHGTGVGTMTSDLCSDGLNVNDGSAGQPTICGSNETYNFYKWTSPQATAQTYSIYVTYQLPSTFKTFQSGTTSIMGRTDNGPSTGTGTVQYSVYRNSGAGLSQCGSTVPVSTGTSSSWATGVASGAADPSTCGFVGGNTIVFKIDVIANVNASAYVGNLGFTYTNQ